MMIALALLAALMPQDEAAAKAALETYKTTVGKSKDAKSHADAVTELAKTAHESVAVRLGSLLATDEREVRIAAATGLGTFNKTPELKVSAAKFLVQALTAGANAREIEVRLAIFAALGALQEESSVNAVKSHFDDRDPKIACAAIAAAGAIRSKSVVEPLIQVVRDCERIQSGSGALPPAPLPTKGKPPAKPPPPPPGKDNTDKEKKDRASAVGAAAEAALSGMTGQNFKTGDEWERWWSKNRSTFTPK
ncbi:MAG: HEAT repeat domain-containing protein [Planctomycetes bacterium]|nr:HEAT repeat domain-containing protein [Planctomycetota bacterium]